MIHLLLRHRKLLGERLEECSIDELQSLEVKLEKSLHIVRGRKVSYFPCYSPMFSEMTRPLQMLTVCYLTIADSVARRAGPKAERKGMSIPISLLPYRLQYPETSERSVANFVMFVSCININQETTLRKNNEDLREKVSSESSSTMLRLFQFEWNN
jgi:hypothetical protein